MRVIARRLRTISSRSSASVLIWPSRSFFAAASSLSPSSIRLVAEPRIDAKGVRKSCDTDASKVLRTRSVSVAVLALTISRASDARSSAAAVCSTNVSSKARASESSGGAVFLLGNADDPKSLRRRLQGNEVPWDDRQSACVRAGRLAMAVGPARRGHGGGVERILRRPGRRQREVIVVRQQDDHRPSEACMDLARRALGDAVERGEARKPPRELVEAPHGPHAVGRNPRLLAHAAGQSGADNRDDEKNDQRKQLVGLGNGEGIERRE